MQLSLSEAAKLAGISKSALFKAVKRGTVSAVRADVSAEWRVDIAELERVYALTSASVDTVDKGHDDHSPARNPGVDISAERQHFEERIKALESERDYLRQALQAETEERRQLVRMLTAPQTSAEKSARTPWTWLIWPVLGIVAMLAAVSLKWMNS